MHQVAYLRVTVLDEGAQRGEFRVVFNVDGQRPIELGCERRRHLRVGPPQGGRQSDGATLIVDEPGSGQRARRHGCVQFVEDAAHQLGGLTHDAVRVARVRGERHCVLHHGFPDEVHY